jgi:hypothetical protein
MTRRQLPLALVALISCAGLPSITSAQESVQAPTLTEGDRWVYTTHAERLVKIEDNELIFVVEGSTGGLRRRNRALTAIPEQGVFDPPHNSIQFPLKVGNQWSHSYEYKGIRRTAHYQVKAYEKLSLGGSDYAAFRIEGIDQRNDRPFGMKILIWYSPDVRGIVKLFRQDMSSRDVMQDYELVRFEPGR